MPTTNTSDPADEATHRRTSPKSPLRYARISHETDREHFALDSHEYDGEESESDASDDDDDVEALALSTEEGGPPTPARTDEGPEEREESSSPCPFCGRPMNRYHDCSAFPRAEDRLSTPYPDGLPSSGDSGWDLDSDDSKSGDDNPRNRGDSTKHRETTVRRSANRMREGHGGADEENQSSRPPISASSRN